MSIDPRSFNLPDTQNLGVEQIDNVGRAVITLAREVCVLTDRLAVLESVLADKGVDVADAIDGHQPDEALQERIDRLTGKIIADLVAALKGD